MKYLLAILLLVSLTACQPSYTKKEQLILKVDPVLMVPPTNLKQLGTKHEN